LKHINSKAQNLHYFCITDGAKIRFIVIKLPLIIFFLCAFSVVSESYAATEIYIVRHGETVGNVTHVHSYENDRTFSTQGKQQVARLTDWLSGSSFDHIIVSPKYRTLNTILPYLKRHNLQAEIWPELQECCWQKTGRKSSFNLRRGNKIILEAQMQHYFIFPNAAAHRAYNAQNYGDGLLQTFKAIQLIRQRFGGSGKRILIVAHYHIGSRLLELLQGMEPDGRYKLSNAKISYLRENRDGTFRLISLNQ